MNKVELAGAVASKLSEVAGKKVSKNGAGVSGVAVVDAVLETIVETITSGEAVKLTGFGTFEARDTNARTGRNPQTGEELEIPASKRPAFKPAQGLKDAVKA